jgi:hypothetical protein
MIKNIQVADLLDDTANLLDLEESNPFRVRSYRNAAKILREMDKPVAKIVEEEGLDGLKALPGIGQRLAVSIREIIHTGHFRLLNQLERQLSPERVIRRVPGIGEKLAERIYSKLDVETLPELEMAAHNGRLYEIERLGHLKIEGIKNALAGMLGRKGKSSYKKYLKNESAQEEPTVDLILEVDRIYLEKAHKGKLRKIAPKRFNPDRKKWLPVMNIKKKGWSFTLLFSNSARAHELGKADDWVVVYYDNGRVEGQNTIITAGSGSMEGKRIVRGREDECQNYY